MKGRKLKMIKTKSDLIAIRDAYANEVAYRKSGSTVKSKYEKHVLICGGTGCTSSKSVQIKERTGR